MKRERVELNIEDLINLIESYNQKKINVDINRFLDLSIQGKKICNLNYFLC
jgi:hypothetical protein